MSDRVVPQFVHLVGMFQQRQGTVADQVDGGFMPGDQQKKDHRQQFVFAQRVTGLLGLGQGAHQIVVRIGPPLPDDLADIANERPSARDGLQHGPR